MIDPIEEEAERPAPASSETPAASAGGRSLILAVLLSVLLSGAISALVATLIVRSETRTNTRSVDLGSHVTINEDSAIEQVATQALPAVVSITAGAQAGSRVHGSGFFVTKDGYIVTTTSVVADASGLLVLGQSDVKPHDARVVDSDCATGLAVIKVDGVSDAPTLAFGDATGLKIGQTLVALGGPLETQSRVVHGIVSRQHAAERVNDPVDSSRQLQRSDTIDVDSPFTAGVAGGPVLNTGGQVVGVAALASGGSGASSPSSFALTSVQLQPEVEQIVQSGRLSVPSLGASWTDLSPLDAAAKGLSGGAVVTAITAGGAADQAGVKVGDILTQLDEVKIDQAHPLSSLLITQFRGGQRVTATLLRGGSSTQVQLTLVADHPTCA